MIALTGVFRLPDVQRTDHHRFDHGACWRLPVQVVRTCRRCRLAYQADACEQIDVQLHSKIDENGLRSQLVLELKRSGFLASSETHAREGHGDIIVSRANSEGNTAGRILVQPNEGGRIVMSSSTCLSVTAAKFIVCLLKLSIGLTRRPATFR